MSFDAFRRSRSGKNAESRQRPPGGAELVTRPRNSRHVARKSATPLSDTSGDRSGVLREDLQKGRLRRRGHEVRLRRPGPTAGDPAQTRGGRLGESAQGC